MRVSCSTLSKVTNVNFSIDVDMDELNLLIAMFAANERIPNLLIKEHDLKTYADREKLSRLMGELHRAAVKVKMHC
jgi:hypothetical protein